MANASAIQGVTEGLNQSMGNILQAARDTRTQAVQNLQMNQLQRQEAIGKEQFAEWQKDQEKVKKEDIEKVNPYAAYMIEPAKAAGLIVGDEQEFTRGQLKEAQKYFMSNPRVLSSVIDKSYQTNLAKDQQFEIAIADEQKKLPELMQNPIGNAKKIQDIQNRIAEYEQQRKPFSDGRMRDSQVRDHLKMLVQAQDYEKLPAEDKAIYQSLVDQGIQTPSMQQVLQEKNKMKEREITTEMKNFEAETLGMTAKRGTPEYAQAYSNWRKKQMDDKTATYAKGRYYSIYNLETGKVEKKSGDWIGTHPGASIDSTDPDVIALKDHEKYASGISRFTNRIDTLGKTILNTMEKNGLNQGSKFKNYTVQQLIGKGIIGKGDVQALSQQMAGFGAELGKVESGSIGIGGATVEAIKTFRVDPNMPVGEFAKYLSGALDASQSVTDAMNMTKKSIYTNIYSGTNYPVPGHIGKDQSKGRGETKSQKTAPVQSLSEQEARKALKDKGYSAPDIDKYIEQGKKAGKIAAAGNIQLAEVKPEDVPIGSGKAGQAKNITQLQKDYNKALLDGDFDKADEIHRQIQELAKQMQGVG